jgi:hypothetical protein
MSKDENDGSNSLMAAITNPSKGVSQWFIALGLWGIMLAVLNIMGLAHPIIGHGAAFSPSKQPMQLLR